MRWFWIDRFTEFVCGRHATAIKNVSLAEEYLQDHFSGYPVFPNSLVIEGMAQAGGLLASEVHGFERIVVLGKVARAKFHFLARPGDTIVYRTDIETVRDGGAVVSVTSHVGDRKQADAEIFFAHLGENRGNGADESVPRLFEPKDLLTWLEVLGVFDIGRNADGSPMAVSQYHFAESAD